MSLPNKIKICSTASTLIGGAPIQSFDEGSVEAEIAQSLYEDMYENLLRYRPWTFCRDYIKPPLSNKESVFGYKYVYVIPNTVLTVEDIGGADFRLKLNELHTNEKDPVVSVLLKPDEAILPADFTLALTYAIAAEMAVPVSENTTKAQYYEQKLAAQIMRAADNDIAQEPAQSFDNSPLFMSHYGY